MRHIILLLLLLLLVSGAAFGADIYHISGHGQSLCLGVNGTPALSTTQPYSNKLLGSLGTTVAALVETGDESPFSAMANQLTSMGGLAIVTEARARNNTDPAAAINDCVGGNGYSTIAKGTNPYSKWLTTIQAAGSTLTAAGLTYKYAGFLNVHGEQDYLNAMSATTYAANLVQWQSDLQGDVRTTLGTTSAYPMLVSQMSSWTGYRGTQPLQCAFGNCTGTQGRSTPLGQLDAARNNPGVIYMLGPRYQYAYSDYAHLTNASYRQLGELAGKVWKRILVDHESWTGMVPRSITRSGATVTVRLWVPTGSIAQDTTTVTDATYCQMGVGADGATCTAAGGYWVNKGFEWWDGSGTSKPYVLSVSIASSDTITITLSATPSGSNQRLRYAFTGPYISSGDGRAKTYEEDATHQPHGNFRDTETVVGVSSGVALHDWLVTFDDAVPTTWAPPAYQGVFPMPGGFRRQ